MRHENYVAPIVCVAEIMQFIGKLIERSRFRIGKRTLSNPCTIIHAQSPRSVVILKNPAEGVASRETPSSNEDYRRLALPLAGPGDPIAANLGELPIMLRR